jgi:hypothetical protein
MLLVALRPDFYTFIRVADGPLGIISFLFFVIPKCKSSHNLFALLVVAQHTGRSSIFLYS